MKRALSLLLALVLLVCLAPAAFAAEDEATQAAETLHALGLFQGKGNDADGNPIYDLGSAPTRMEAVTMLVRLLGKEAEAKAGTWETPFTDVDDWAKPYVGYAYASGLTKGTGDTTFGGKSLVTATQYLTFVLRALGYDSSKDFKWDAAWELTDELGITHGEYTAENNADFLRGNVAQISLGALPAKMNGAAFTLAEKLIGEGVFTAEQYKEATGSAENEEFDPNSPENVARYAFEYDAERDGYVITGYKKTAFIAPYGVVLDSDVCAFPSEYEGKPVVELRTPIGIYADKITIPASMTIIENNRLDGIVACKEIVVDPENPAFCSVDGVLMSKDQTELIRFPSGKDMTSYRVPDTVKRIESFAFSGGDQYDPDKHVYIPASVQYVDEWAFHTTNLTVHIEGSTENWNPLCFAFYLFPLQVVTASDLSVFSPADTYVEKKGDSNVTINAIEYAMGDELAAIRISYHKSTDEYARGYITFHEYNEKEDRMVRLGDIRHGDRETFFRFDDGDGEVTVYLPKDYRTAACNLDFDWKPGNQETVWGEYEIIWIFPGGAPEWAKNGQN